MKVIIYKFLICAGFLVFIFLALPRQSFAQYACTGPMWADGSSPWWGCFPDCGSCPGDTCIYDPGSCPFCGDGICSGGENSSSCPGDCPPPPPPPPVCGNGVIEAGEACDDGGANGACPSACNTSCGINSCGPPPPVCGNGVIEAGEACDDGGANGACPAACNTSCGINSCGGGGGYSPPYNNPPPYYNPPPSLHTISGNVFVDTNGNKIKDGGEVNYTAGNSTIYIAGSPITTANGAYTSSFINEGAYTVSYTSLPGGYSVTHPLTGPPPSFSVTVGPGCTINPAIAGGGSCDGSNNIINLNFAITNSTAWFQGYTLDMRIDNGFTDLLPSLQFASAIDAALGTTGGAIYTGKYSQSFPPTQASNPSNWLVGGSSYGEEYVSGNRLFTSYSYLRNNAARGNITPVDMTGNDTGGNSVCSGGGIANCTLNPSLAKGVYIANGALTLNTSSLPGGKNFIFLINGALTINGNITVPNTSTALFSANTTITVNRAVGAAANSLPKPAGQIQGFFTAGTNFVLDGYNNCSPKDKMLNIEGTVTVNANGAGGSITNNRNLCADNATIPSFTITPRLDMILNAPAFMMKNNNISNEVAP